MKNSIIYKNKFPINLDLVETIELDCETNDHILFYMRSGRLITWHMEGNNEESHARMDSVYTEIIKHIRSHEIKVMYKPVRMGKD